MVKIKPKSRVYICYIISPSVYNTVFSRPPASGLPRVLSHAGGMAGGTIPKYAGPGHTFFSEVDINGSTIKLGDLGTKVLRKGILDLSFCVRLPFKNSFPP